MQSLPQRQARGSALQKAKLMFVLGTVRNLASQWAVHFSCRLAALYFQIGDLDACMTSAKTACQWAASLAQEVQVRVFIHT